MPMSSHLQFAWDARKSSLTILRRLTAEPWETGGKGTPTQWQERHLPVKYFAASDN